MEFKKYRDKYRWTGIITRFSEIFLILSVYFPPLVSQRFDSRIPELFNFTRVFVRPVSRGRRRFQVSQVHFAGSELLAGAWFQQDRSVEWLVQTQGLSLREAWRQASEVPAGILGEDLPRLEVGQEASFVLATWDDGLIIHQSVHSGRPYLAPPIRTTDCETGEETG